MGAALFAGVALLAAAAASSAQTPRVPREELDGLQAAVEAAVSRVSRPAGLFAGRPGRAYHLEGYGAMVVLAPRALPRSRRAPEAIEVRALTELTRGLEQHLATVTNGDERRRLERALDALRAGLPGPMPPVAVRAPLARRTKPGEIHALQEEAESFRRAAEQAMAKAERDVRFQLRLPDPPPAPPDAPEAAEVPAPPAPPAPTIVFAPLAPGARVPPRPPLPGLLAPGHDGPFWFGDTDVEVAPEELMANVREAIVAGLAGHRGALAHLRPEDVVVVAVDFLPRIADRAAARTVVARAKKKDLAAARAGQLAAGELRRRVVFDEY